MREGGKRRERERERERKGGREGGSDLWTSNADTARVGLIYYVGQRP